MWIIRAERGLCAEASSYTPEGRRFTRMSTTVEGGHHRCLNPNHAGSSSGSSQRPGCDRCRGRMGRNVRPSRHMGADQPLEATSSPAFLFVVCYESFRICSITRRGPRSGSDCTRHSLLNSTTCSAPSLPRDYHRKPPSPVRLLHRASKVTGVGQARRGRDIPDNYSSQRLESGLQNPTLVRVMRQPPGRI